MTWREEFESLALASPEREACALLIVEGGKETLIHCVNISEFDDHFEIDANDYSKAEDRGEVLAVIHSHPKGNASPSEYDLVSCENTGVVWHIFANHNRQWNEIRPKGYEAPLVGRQWMHGVLDCYSLVRDYYKKELCIIMHDYERQFEWWNKGENLYLDNYAKEGFFEVPLKQIQKHDVILMQVMSPVVNHAAVYLGDGLILQHLHRRLSSRDVYGGYWQKHTVKVMRHESNKTLR